jgi:isopentenyldiphosphate isomerase
VASDELIDWVDEQDRVIGQVTRARMRAENLLHRCIAVLCLHPDGRASVHKRTASKDVFPSLYDAFVGGVVGAGESYDAAAVREIEEELGIVGPTPEPLFQHLYDGPESRSHTRVYRVTWAGPIRHQPSEVAWGGYCDLAALASGGLGFALVPDGAEFLERYLALYGPKSA